MDMIRGLISTPSVSSVDPCLDQGNRAVIDLLANWLSDTGFAVEVMPLPGEPGKANLIATLGSGPGGLVLPGHTDTVPYDEGKWQNRPVQTNRGQPTALRTGHLGYEIIPGTGY